MKEKNKRLLAAVLACAALVLCGCAGKDKGVAKLDPKNPTTVTVWHYYNGVQQIAFDQLVKQFNEGVGKETGVYVEAHSQGNVGVLESSVLAAFNQDAGSAKAPDIFSSYADTAYAIERMGKLVNVGQYMTEEEMAEYVDSFVEEGRIGENTELRIFPTAKSSEVFMMNRNAWEEFANATGASLESLSTLEGVVRTAQAYYEWTDSLTPEIPNDGRAFFGRDAMANLFVVGSMQLGKEIFKVENGRVTFQVDHDIIRRIWECSYVPYVKGYFSACGRFRSDDVKIGEIIAYVGSTSSANYFPDTVETEEGSEEIGYIILPPPEFEGGQPYAVQQGAGMVVTKSTPERELAAVTFLEWFTHDENNLLFGCSSGYMPVKKAAARREKLDEVIERRQINMPGKTYDALALCMDMLQTHTFYTSKAFENGADARKVLENHLSDQATQDRELVVSRLQAGMSLEEATADLVSDEAFENWFAAFKQALEDAVR